MPDNKKPVINIDVQDKYEVGDEVHAQIDDEIHFDASGSTDPDGEIVFYKWTFPPDTNILNEVSPTHTFKSGGTYSVNLIIIDNNGSSASSNTTVVIGSGANRAPTAAISVSSQANAGDSVQFTGSGSSDPDTGDSIAAYLWDFGDGLASTDMNPTHAYSSAGSYLITLTVTDQNGVEGSISTNILIKSKSSDESPGFEVIFVLLAIAVILISAKRKNK